MRWPAEWEEHEATWLIWPHNRETWGEHLAAVERAFATIVAALAPHERVCLLATSDRVSERARTVLGRTGVTPAVPARAHAEASGDLARASHPGVELVAIESDDSWIRDTGPIFVERRERGGALREGVCFRFEAWGRKYPPWERDARVARRIAAQAGARVRTPDLVLEGGAIDGDGNGTVLTTEECLLHPNRGGGTARDRDALERALSEHLGARHVIWLGRGIAGDDTDGHVDDVARFIAPGVVVTAVESDPEDVNFEALRENRERLRTACDADGAPLRIVELPMPPPVVLNGRRLPASYANFYLANGLALVPVFGVAEDACAIEILSQHLKCRRIVGIPARKLVVGLGAIHCLSQQEPRAPGARGPRAAGASLDARGRGGSDES